MPIRLGQLASELQVCLCLHSVGITAHSPPWYMVKYSVLWQRGKRFRSHFFVFVFTDEETGVALLEPLHYTKEL